MHGNMTLTDPKLSFHLAQLGQKLLGAAIAIFIAVKFHKMFLQLFLKTENL